jgi:hypothetical protein
VYPRLGVRNRKHSTRPCTVVVVHYNTRAASYTHRRHSTTRARAPPQAAYLAGAYLVVMFVARVRAYAFYTVGRRGFSSLLPTNARARTNPPPCRSLLRPRARSSVRVRDPIRRCVVHTSPTNFNKKPRRRDNYRFRSLSLSLSLSLSRVSTVVVR